MKVLAPRKSHEPRRGAAMVEAALTLPVLLLLIFGSIEAAEAIHTRHAVAVAAYDAARLATKSGGTESVARERSEALLDSMGVEGYSISFLTDIEEIERGEVVSVRVTAPSNTLGLLPLFNGAEFTKTVHMVRL